jgi:hypothetical protein
MFDKPDVICARGVSRIPDDGRGQCFGCKNRVVDHDLVNPMKGLRDF